jgi:hypothetical protein
MVVVCGHNMGDIFRRNALQSRAARRAESRGRGRRADGDEFTFDPVDAASRNVTQGKTYEPVPLTPKEDEIRRGGGIFDVGRREFRRRSRRARDRLAGRRRRARMTTTEQIIWAHRVDKDRRELKPATTLRSTPICCRRRTARRRSAIHTFNQITGGNPIYPRLAADRQRPLRVHRPARRRQADGIGREFARLQGMEKPYYATPGDGIFHFYFPEQGLVMPGQFIPGADSHSRAYGAYWRGRIGVGSTTLGFGWATGYIYFTLAERRRVVFDGACSPGSAARTSSSSCCGAGARSSRRDVGRARRREHAAADRVPATRSRT